MTVIVVIAINEIPEEGIKVESKSMEFDRTPIECIVARDCIEKITSDLYITEKDSDA